MGDRIYFLGGGKMAESIIRAFISKGVQPDKIEVCELIEKRRKFLEETYGINTIGEVGTSISKCDIVILAVNPKQISNVAKSIKGKLNENSVVVSIACGISIDALESYLGDVKVVRVIPNTLSEVGNGYTSLSFNKYITEEEKIKIIELYEKLGKVMCIEESKCNAFQSFVCTGPFWIYKFIESMIEAGIYVGLTREEARDFTIENLLGVAKTLEQTGMSPTARIEELTSPGGITIEAMKTLVDKGGYTSQTIESVYAALKKCEKMG